MQDYDGADGTGSPGTAVREGVEAGGGPDETFMRAALAEARKAREHGEVPVGAVVTREGEVVGRGGNRVRETGDPTAHAEVAAIRSAARRLGNYRLTGCDLFVTVEPCLMCAGTLLHARIRRLVYGAPEPKFGGVESKVRLESLRLPHRLQVVSGVLAEEGRDLLRDFFRERRKGGRAPRPPAADVGAERP